MILITAFDAFGGAATNASEQLLTGLKEDSDAFCVVFPTKFDAAGKRIVQLIRELAPRAVICFGVSNEETAVCLERLARNQDNATLPDNAGTVRLGSMIVADGPEHYESTIPYAAIASELATRQIPCTISEDAGGFVCNHVFYRALHEIECSGRETLCGFIHVPPIRDAEDFSILTEAVVTCIAITKAAST